MVVAAVASAASVAAAEAVVMEAGIGCRRETFRLVRLGSSSLQSFAWRASVLMG